MMPANQRRVLVAGAAGSEKLLPFYWRIAVRPNLGQAVFLVLLMLGGALIEAFTIGLSIPLVDLLMDPAKAAQGGTLAVMSSVLSFMGINPETNTVVFALLLVAMILFVFRGGVALLTRCMTAGVAIRLKRRIKSLLFGKAMNARYEDISKRARGALVHDITIPSDAIHTSIINLGELFTAFFNCAVMVGLLIHISWWASLLVALLAYGGLKTWGKLCERPATSCGRMLYDSQRAQAKLELDAVDGLKIVKAYGLERDMVTRQQALLDLEVKPTVKLAFFRYGNGLMHEIIIGSAIVGLGTATFLLPSLGFRFSMLAAFLLATRRIAPSLTSINAVWVELSRKKRSLEVVDEFLHHLPQQREGGRIPDTIETVAIERLSFSYASNPDRQVLKDVSIRMRKGTATALVGSTGAGKSTIVSLLMGLYEPSQGAIHVNNEDLTRVNLAAWRRRVGYVSQDIFVFNESIKDNIALGYQDVPQDRIEWAARIAQLHDYIISLPEGYDTVVGDRGLRLSGGQCQRLAIARAIFRRPEVLIFDEATSALDNLTERAVYEAFSAMHRDAIILIVAHRLSTVRAADQILVIESGKIVEEGLHAELMNRGGVYARLYDENRVLAAQGAPG